MAPPLPVGSTVLYPALSDAAEREHGEIRSTALVEWIRQNTLEAQCHVGIKKCNPSEHAHMTAYVQSNTVPVVSALPVARVLHRRTRNEE